MKYRIGDANGYNADQIQKSTGKVVLRVYGLPMCHSVKDIEREPVVAWQERLSFARHIVNFLNQETMK